MSHPNLPDVSTPNHRLNLGNPADDDSQIFDDYLKPSEPPTAPRTAPTYQLPEPPTPTKLLSVGQEVDPTWGSATLLLPEDIRRIYLVIRVFSLIDEANDGVLLRDDGGSMLGLARLYHAERIELTGHTGAIYCTAFNAADAETPNNVRIDVWSVTR